MIELHFRTSQNKRTHVEFNRRCKFLPTFQIHERYSSLRNVDAEKFDFVAARFKVTTEANEIAFLSCLAWGSAIILQRTASVGFQNRGLTGDCLPICDPANGRAFSNWIKTFQRVWVTLITPVLSEAGQMTQ